MDVLEEACWDWENFQDKKLAGKEDGLRLTAHLAASPGFNCV